MSWSRTISSTRSSNTASSYAQPPSAAGCGGHSRYAVAGVSSVVKQYSCCPPAHRGVDPLRPRAGAAPSHRSTGRTAPHSERPSELAVSNTCCVK